MAQSKPDETPMMRQFYSLKEKHPDAVLLFRCGDFYETYAQDAVEAAEILGITLTRRNNGKNGAMALEMAGFPHHRGQPGAPAPDGAEKRGRGRNLERGHGDPFRSRRLQRFDRAAGWKHRLPVRGRRTERLRGYFSGHSDTG